MRVTDYDHYNYPLGRYPQNEKNPEYAPSGYIRSRSVFNVQGHEEDVGHAKKSLQRFNEMSKDEEIETRRKAYQDAAKWREIIAKRFAHQARYRTIANGEIDTLKLENELDICNHEENMVNIKRQRFECLLEFQQRKKNCMTLSEVIKACKNRDEKLESVQDFLEDELHCKETWTKKFEHDMKGLEDEFQKVERVLEILQEGFNAMQKLCDKKARRTWSKFGNVVETFDFFLTRMKPYDFLVRSARRKRNSDGELIDEEQFFAPAAAVIKVIKEHPRYPKPSSIMHGVL